MSDLQTLVAQEVQKQLAAIAADQTTKKVLEFLKNRNSADAYVVETGGDSTSWYRVWSDGFIEQGGVFPKNTAHVDNVISLTKPFTTLNYQAIVQPTWGSNDGLGSRISKKTLNSFTAVFASADDPHAMWFACGY